MGPDNYEDRESFAFSRLMLGLPILLGNGGKSIHSFIYAGDVANALVAILKSGGSADKQAFNIAVPQATTSRGFVELAAKVSGKDPKIINYDPRDYDLDIHNFDLKNVAFPFPENNGYLGSEKINRILGFTPEKSLLDMLEIYFAWWLKQGKFTPKEYPLETRILSSLK